MVIECLSAHGVVFAHGSCRLWPSMRDGFGAGGGRATNCNDSPKRRASPACRDVSHVQPSHRSQRRGARAAPCADAWHATSSRQRRAAPRRATIPPTHYASIGWGNATMSPALISPERCPMPTPARNARGGLTDTGGGWPIARARAMAALLSIAIAIVDCVFVVVVV